ncbi:Protein Y71H10B.1 a [Aphelenchoides avenae]|nr:Protein Y71H10B.1 a [Aphelenchus avenae]
MDEAASHKRPPEQRIFVNRNLRVDKIKFFGFDMDYTLAGTVCSYLLQGLAVLVLVYKSPDMESMAFDLIVERMISIGYPADFKNFKYNPIFAVRGLWFDHLYGNLLKVDGFGNILVALHGFNYMTSAEIEELYPNKFLGLSDKRVYVLNTLFNLPETYLVACVVDYFDRHGDYQQTSDKTGVKSKSGESEVFMSYKSIFQDVRSAVDWVHFDSDMKRIILGNMEKYVAKDERIVTLLTQLRKSGRKTFLLTNSDYPYTNGIMRYLLGPDWTSYFDITIVDAKKPLWFAEGTVFREVNTVTGAKNIGIHAGPLRQGAVYAGGSCDAFRRLVKARGKDVLYIGDHVFGDVLRSKKARGWRTFLVIPELNHELTVWTEGRTLFEKLRELDSCLADIYKNLDSTTKDKPEIGEMLRSIKKVTGEMDQEYSAIGSLFRSGSRTTFFASQVERYADIYASSCYNLVHYPTFYFFRAPMMLMPHESTVDHASTMRQRNKPTRQDSVGQQVRGWSKMMSKSNTFCFEEEEDESQSNGSQSSDTEQSPTASGRREKEDQDGALDEVKEQHNDGLNNVDVIVPTPSFVEPGM